MTRYDAMMTLGLSLNACEADVRRAWHKKAKFYHPDSPYGDRSAFIQCKRAYETLIPPAPQYMRVRAHSRAV